MKTVHDLLRSMGSEAFLNFVFILNWDTKVYRIIICSNTMIQINFIILDKFLLCELADGGECGL